MTNIRARLSDIFAKAPSSPFLFVGSGFSRRYLGTEDWNGLLERFCEGIRPYGYYFSKAEGYSPSIASFMSVDLHEAWWRDDKYADIREKNKAKIISKSSPLKIVIAEYLRDVMTDLNLFEDHREEVELLRDLPVDGVVTTNWDTFIEHILPDFKTYIGQESLLSSSPQGIGEVYKIHGCVSKPHSLVLTREDYENYYDKNAYLAAKLITLFVEHPFIFIGYKLNDDNIIRIFSSIVRCLDETNLEKLQNNLIFLQRSKGEEDAISHTVIPLENCQLPITVVKTDDFSSVYKSIIDHKRKIPARILRYFKEQLYEIVKEDDPKGKIVVADIDQIDDYRDLEFVVGVGVGERLGDEGYSPIHVNDIVEHFLFDNRGYDSKKLVQNTIPGLAHPKFIPVFRFLTESGIDSFAAYEKSGLNLDEQVYLKRRKFMTEAALKAYRNQGKGKSFSELVETKPAYYVIQWIPVLNRDELNRDEVLAYLRDNYEYFKNSTYMSYFRKATAYMDRVLFRWREN